MCIRDSVNTAEVICPRHVFAHGGIKQANRNGVALKQDEVSEARSRSPGVVELRSVLRGILHRLARIHQDVSDEIRLLLVLLHIITVASAQDFPVEMTDIVAGHVFTMLREFHSEAAERRAMSAGHITLDDLSRLDAELLGALDRFGICLLYTSD